MSNEQLFGSGLYKDGRADHDGLKLVLHRYIIDAIEETGKNLLEGSRVSLAQFVTERVAEYVSRLHLAISRYEMERLAEEIVDELTGFGPLEVLLRDPAVTEILVNGPHRVFVEREGRLSQSDLRFIDDHHVERVMQCLSILETQPMGADRLLRQVADYSMPNVSDKVVRILHSHVDYVNRVVWKRY